MMTLNSVLKILIPTLTSIISINFLVLTFLLGQYENYKHRDDDLELLYKKAIQILLVALILATVSLGLAGLSSANPIGVGCYLLSLAIGGYVAEILLLVGGISWVIHTRVRGDLYVWE